MATPDPTPSPTGRFSLAKRSGARLGAMSRVEGLKGIGSLENRRVGARNGGARLF